MKVVLITGISSGFGKQTAQLLALNGYKVYGTVRKDTDKIDNVNYIYLDVTSETSIMKAVQDIYKNEGRIDVLINNAGIGIAAPIEYTEITEIEKIMDVNFMGAVRMTKAVLPIMRKQSSGHIISISSIGGVIGLPFQGVYSASKFAMEGFFQALYNEVKPFNIKVSLINPGDFNTEFTSNRPQVNKEDFDTIYSQYNKTISIIEKDESNGLKPELLAKSILKMISKKNPPLSQIIATPIQKFSVYLKRILPAKIFYSIIDDYYK